MRLRRLRKILLGELPEVHLSLRSSNDGNRLLYMNHLHPQMPVTLRCILLVVASPKIIGIGWTSRVEMLMEKAAAMNGSTSRESHERYDPSIRGFVRICVFHHNHCHADISSKLCALRHDDDSARKSEAACCDSNAIASLHSALHLPTVKLCQDFDLRRDSAQLLTCALLNPALNTVIHQVGCSPNKATTWSAPLFFPWSWNMLWRELYNHGGDLGPTIGWLYCTPR
jgi:hypothetical protein